MEGIQPLNKEIMFGLFKKKTALEKLELKYKRLLDESFKLSTIDRKKSDLKRAEAEAVIEEIEALKAKE